jgi:hypothetical protein
MKIRFILVSILRQATENTNHSITNTTKNITNTTILTTKTKITDTKTTTTTKSTFDPIPDPITDNNIDFRLALERIKTVTAILNVLHDC